MARHKDLEWNLPDRTMTMTEHATVAVLMDIRDELKRLNAVFACGNFQAIPSKLEKIVQNTTKRKRGRPKKVERKAA